jgi:hypothetical protein
MNKFCWLVFLCFCLFGCAWFQSDTEQEPELHDPSEMSLLMRKMVEYSKQAKQNLANGKALDSIPSRFYDLLTLKASRNEQKEVPFQNMAIYYLAQLRGLERADSQEYFYRESINACKSCHSTYCNGPMLIIEKLAPDKPSY